MMPDEGICPRGYQYYSCRSNAFSGCCSVNPCSMSDCPPSFLPDQSREDATTTGSGTEPLTPTPTPSTASTPPTKTDSGVTHTIPNNSVVTVTKHTVVFSEAPPWTEPSSSYTAGDPTSETAASTAPSCSTCTPAPSSTSPPSADGSGAGVVPSGAIAGAATGGAVIVAIVLILLFVSRHRKKKRGRGYASETETLGRDSHVNGSEKLDPSQEGPLRPSSDPFAPFGGRADQPEQLPRPPSGTFEMDGAGIAPVELPASSIPEAPDTHTATRAPREEAPPGTGTGTGPTPAADPAATLASAPSPRGKITYVNQWNQYKAMAAGEPV
ncbi:hypothetical protein E4U41_001017 [Claviceps citrina]|nr:hypothetical protein E4U41_001017 [Claviceps citrina]